MKQAAHDGTAAAAKRKYTPYQRRLLVFLSVATFFEGYDFVALVQALPRIVAEMGLQETDTGLMVSLINIGAILSFFIVYLADKHGRRPLLMVTIVGYTVCSLLTGLAGSAWAFIVVQLLARVFLLGELAVSMVYAAEEFPSDRRGRVIGHLQVAATLGTIFCAGMTPLLLKSDLGWRAIYFVGAVPLILIAFARRNLRETERFKAQQSSAGANGYRELLQLIKGPYRRRVLVVASVWALTYMCTNSLITFWNLHAINSLGMTYEAVSKCIMMAALGATPLLFLVGRLLETGRRRAALLTYGMLFAGAYGCYNLSGVPLLTLSLTVSVFAVAGVVPILNAYTVELFPTELRASAYAWCNSLLGRLGFVLSPLLVGWAASRFGYGPAVTATIAFPAIALVLILRNLKETAGFSLEQTSQLDPVEERAVA
ncbi:MFS transporter [Pseudoduganella buxea]|uniref:MFS transporter n=1 Tax=Pseudoduganella buxea TaxID=1949069 RepID=A0A6I3T6D7_9BURK|nr:MFS transporter [Pseudoduganella buxea]MTV56316.1 MFS transporter [Pseudoduganella buxea]GGB95714.1 MFS transporter [Pseudoduganella buxea]